MSGCFFGTRCRITVVSSGVDRAIVSSFVYTKHQNVMEGQTDRQTDRSPLDNTVVEGL